MRDGPTIRGRAEIVDAFVDLLFLEGLMKPSFVVSVYSTVVNDLMNQSVCAVLVQLHPDAMDDLLKYGDTRLPDALERGMPVMYYESAKPVATWMQAGTRHFCCKNAGRMIDMRKGP